jgi:hypothetical protein
MATKPTDQAPSENVLALMRGVALQAVRFIRTSTELVGVKAGDVLDRLSVQVKSGGTKSPDDPQTVRAYIGLHCIVSPRQDAERQAAKLSCDLTLDYRVNDPELFARLTDDDCAQFALFNGIYNGWPYMREFCQSASLRMGLPAPVILPTLPAGRPAEMRQPLAPDAKQ